MNKIEKNLVGVLTEEMFISLYKIKMILVGKDFYPLPFVWLLIPVRPKYSKD